MNCLRSLERWDRGFESRSMHGCLYVRLFWDCVVLCVGSGLATDLSVVQGALQFVQTDYEAEEAWVQQRALEPLMNE
jgi:hypothetical protein